MAVGFVLAFGFDVAGALGCGSIGVVDLMTGFPLPGLSGLDFFLALILETALANGDLGPTRGSVLKLF